MTETTDIDPELAAVAPELFVPDVASATAFYRDVLGFAVMRQSSDFAVVRLGDAVLMLAEPPARFREVAASLTSLAWRLQIRIMVSDVDAMHARCVASGVSIVTPLRDREYGLRDFACLDLNGFCLRFATPVGV